MSADERARVERLYRQVQAEIDRLIAAEQVRRDEFRRRLYVEEGFSRVQSIEGIGHSHGVAHGLQVAVDVLARLAFPKPPTG